MPRSRRIVTALLCLVFGIALLPACGDDAQQSAIQSGNVVATTATATPRTTARSVLDRGSMPQLPERRRIYFTNGGDLWQLPIDNVAAPVISGKQILAFAAAPNGDQLVAAIQTQDDNEEFSIVNADSTIASSLKLVDESGTPVSTAPGNGGVASVAWSPQSQSIAVARDDGSISVVDKDGKVKVLVTPHDGSHPGGLSWSPDGKLLSYLDPALPDQPTGLYVVPADSGSSRLLVESGGTDQPVIAASWIGTGALAYIQGRSSAVDRTGDLFAVDAASGKQQLLVSSSQFAPVSGIAAIAPSPDASKLAFTVYVPGEDHPRCFGLWLLDLSALNLTQVSTVRDEAITDLWWASGDLLFRSVPEAGITQPGAYTGAEPFAIYQLDPGAAQPAERYRIGG